MRYFTIPELSRVTRISDCAIRRRVKSGSIKAVMTGGRYLIAEDEISHLLPPVTSTVDNLVQTVVSMAPDLTDDQLSALRIILSAGR